MKKCVRVQIIGNYINKMRYGKEILWGLSTLMTTIKGRAMFFLKLSKRVV